eukprot:117132-Chlamydomonas_euryale.AAC.4
MRVEEASGADRAQHAARSPFLDPHTLASQRVSPARNSASAADAHSCAQPIAVELKTRLDARRREREDPLRDSGPGLLNPRPRLLRGSPAEKAAACRLLRPPSRRHAASATTQGADRAIPTPRRRLPRRCVRRRRPLRDKGEGRNVGRRPTRPSGARARSFSCVPRADLPQSKHCKKIQFTQSLLVPVGQARVRPRQTFRPRQPPPAPTQPPSPFPSLRGARARSAAASAHGARRCGCASADAQPGATILQAPRGPPRPLSRGARRQRHAGPAAARVRL